MIGSIAILGVFARYGNHSLMRTKAAMATTAIATISSIEPTAPFLRFAKQNGGGKYGSLNVKPASVSRHICQSPGSQNPQNSQPSGS